jgi:hypothetical protein
MTEFMKGNSRIDQIVIDATSGPQGGFENLREALKRELVNSGAIARDADSLGYGVRLLPGSAQERVPVAVAARVDHDRVFRVVYPSGNNRFEIFGADQKELDEKERQIYSICGR